MFDEIFATLRERYDISQKHRCDAEIIRNGWEFYRLYSAVELADAIYEYSHMNPWVPNKIYLLLGKNLELLNHPSWIEYFINHGYGYRIINEELYERINMKEMTRYKLDNLYILCRKCTRIRSENMRSMQLVYSINHNLPSIYVNIPIPIDISINMKAYCPDFPLPRTIEEYGRFLQEFPNLIQLVCDKSPMTPTLKIKFGHPLCELIENKVIGAYAIVTGRYTFDHSGANDYFICQAKDSLMKDALKKQLANMGERLVDAFKTDYVTYAWFGDMYNVFRNLSPLNDLDM